jgi:hypothetical protein
VDLPIEVDAEDEVDAEEVTATLKDDVLQLTMPKAGKARNQSFVRAVALAEAGIRSVRSRSAIPSIEVQVVRDRTPEFPSSVTQVTFPPVPIW